MGREANGGRSKAEPGDRERALRGAPGGSRSQAGGRVLDDPLRRAARPPPRREGPPLSVDASRPPRRSGASGRARGRGGALPPTGSTGHGEGVFIAPPPASRSRMAVLTGAKPPMAQPNRDRPRLRRALRR